MPKIKIELDCLKELVKGESSEATETKLKEVEAKNKEQDVRLTDVTNRVVVLENRTDNDNQTLALAGNTLSISNGNEVTLPQYDDSVLKGRVEVLENISGVFADGNPKELYVDEELGEIVVTNYSSHSKQANEKNLLQVYVTNTVEAKVKSPFGGEEISIYENIYFSTTLNESLSGSYKNCVKKNSFLYVEYNMFGSYVEVHLVYEPDNNGEVSKYRKVLTLEELRGEIPARISITKDGVEIGYVEAKFSNLHLIEYDYKIQYKS